MANSDISLVVEKPEERAAARRHSNSEATMAKSIMKDEDESSQKWPSPKVESFFQKWKKIFVASCLFAVVLDPLFLYIPMMKDDIKCMLSDRKLKIAALLLRSLTDLFYIFDIIFQIYTSDKYSSFMHEYRGRHHRSKKRYWRKFFVPTIIKTMWGSYSIIIDILAVLPLPQIAILIIFSEMSDLRSLTAIRMVIMNLFVLLQYVPRVLRFYLSCKEFKMTPKKEIEETAKWVKGVLNFFMYILSSHVLGAVWYFFAIQRMATCWHNACRKANGCNTSTFGCHDHHTDRNITFLNDLCPISPVNTTLFDFGIYITVLQSGIMGSTNYFQKFSNCFWWGLRNLSSLGSNLEPSVDGWENLFAAFVSIIGLLLFLYLIGNLQTYMQLDTQRLEAHRHKMKVERKMKEKDKETELWLSANGIPKSFKSQIMEKVRQELEENRDAGLDYILSVLPLVQSQITDYKHRLEMKGRETELWLSENGIPKRLHEDMKLKIMEKVQQELEEDRDAGLDKIFSILPSDLRSQITGYKDKCRETELWLSENGIPKRLHKDMKLKIMEKVQQELEEDRDAGLDKIFSILPSDLRSQITGYKDRHEMKCRETELWLSANCIPKRLHKEMKLKIMEKVQEELEEDRDADVDKIFSILPSNLQSQITKYKHRHEMKCREAELWLSKNGIPKRLHKDMKLKIMEKVKEELEEDRDAGLDYILSILPSDLRSEIRHYKHRHEKKCRETELWLSKNGIPKRLHKDMKLKIMEKVQQELEEDRDADVDKIFSILPSNLQSQITDYMQRHKMKVERKMEETELWLSKNGIPKRLHKDMKLKIMEKVQEELEEDRDADVDKIFSILPLDLQSQITYYKHRHEMKCRKTESWLSKNGIPKRLHKDMKLKIMEKVQQELEENRDADMDKIFSILPSNLQSQITEYMPMTRLKQVPTLKNMDERVLTSICPYLKPREFDDNSIIIKKGEPLEMMIFIVDGFVSIEERDGSSSSYNSLQQRTRGKGEVCGEELLLWPLSILYFWDVLTLATESAKAIGHVEALVLTSGDLKVAFICKGIEYFCGILMSTCRTFSAKELENATDNYHQSTIIRKSKDATFYKGVLPMPDDDKTVVAVKKYTDIYADVPPEAAVASQTNHINVVRFLGACVEPWLEQALVFEYIPNGTLFEHIHKEEAAGSFEGSSSSPTALLSLELRLKIASETAGALAYLHSLTPPIVHLLLSTKHILLDHHYTAKLSAIGQSQTELWKFGASILSKKENFDPNFEGDRLAEKSDVYSFGVILAELLTSQKPASPNSRGEEPPLAIYLLSSMEEGRLDKILDGKIIFNEATSETAKKVADLAKRCLRSKREERPSMEQVAVELEGLRQFRQSIKGGNPVSQTGQPLCNRKQQ